MNCFMVVAKHNGVYLWNSLNQNGHCLSDGLGSGNIVIDAVGYKWSDALFYINLFDNMLFNIILNNVRNIAMFGIRILE